MVGPDGGLRWSPLSVLQGCGRAWDLVAVGPVRGALGEGRTPTRAARLGLTADPVLLLLLFVLLLLSRRAVLYVHIVYLEGK